eukprot:6263475-Amphidinium_carterae.1
MGRLEKGEGYLATVVPRYLVIRGCPIIESCANSVAIYSTTVDHGFVKFRASDGQERSYAQGYGRNC